MPLCRDCRSPGNAVVLKICTAASPPRPLASEPISPLLHRRAAMFCNHPPCIHTAGAHEQRDCFSLRSARRTSRFAACASPGSSSLRLLHLPLCAHSCSATQRPKVAPLCRDPQVALLRRDPRSPRYAATPNCPATQTPPIAPPRGDSRLPH